MTTPRIEERKVTDTTNEILALIPHIEGFTHSTINHKVDEIIRQALTQAHQAGNKARDKRWMEMLVEHSKLDVVDALRVYVKVQTSDNTIKALTNKK